MRKFKLISALIVALACGIAVGGTCCWLYLSRETGGAIVVTNVSYILSHAIQNEQKLPEVRADLAKVLAGAQIKEVWYVSKRKARQFELTGDAIPARLFEEEAIPRFRIETLPDETVTSFTIRS
jgi:hypothetical protein